MDAMETVSNGAAAPLARMPLTKKERALLAALTAVPGRVVTREELLRTVWGYSEGRRSRTVDVHIQRLRGKLTPESADALKTIVRGGYCWMPTPSRSAEAA